MIDSVTPAASFLIAAVATLITLFLVVPMALGLAHVFGLYTIVLERQCKVYVLFGKVIGQLANPGLYFLLRELGPGALIVNFLGRCYTMDMRLDQQYLRSQPVNSEEGAPMGIGIWYEMYISNPVSYLFKYADPRLPGRERGQRHRPLPEQSEAGGDAREPPRHEPDRAAPRFPLNPRNGVTSSAPSTFARSISATWA